MRRISTTAKVEHCIDSISNHQHSASRRMFVKTTKVETFNEETSDDRSSWTVRQRWRKWQSHENIPTTERLELVFLWLLSQRRSLRLLLSVDRRVLSQQTASQFSLQSNQHRDSWQSVQIYKLNKWEFMSGVEYTNPVQQNVASWNWKLLAEQPKLWRSNGAQNMQKKLCWCSILYRGNILINPIVDVNSYNYVSCEIIWSVCISVLSYF